LFTPDDAGVRGKRAIKLGGGVNFHERLHAELAAKRDQIAQLFIVQCGDRSAGNCPASFSAGFQTCQGSKMKVLAKDWESD